MYHKSTHTISITRLSGKYRGGRWEWFFYDVENPSAKPTLVCHENVDSSEVQFKGATGDFCVNMMRGQSMGGSRASYYYVNF